MTRTLKVRHGCLTLGRSLGIRAAAGCWGCGRAGGAGQISRLTKDKIFLNPAALPWFCRQELPRVRGILTLSRICCRRDFSLIGRRAATRWRALRDPLLPDGWPWTTGSPWGLSAPELSCCKPPALLPGPATPAHALVPSLLSASPAAPGPFPVPQQKLCVIREGIW